MKRLTLILTILIASASCTQLATDAPKRQGWEDKYMGPLYGDVESMTIIEYSLKVSSGVLSRGNIYKKNCFNFNQSGDVTEEAMYDSDGSLIWKSIYKYDSKGNVTERAKYNSDGSFDHKCIYKYDSKGNIAEATEYYGEMQKPKSQTVYTIIYRK